MQYGPIERLRFGDLDVGDPFFESLKEDYAEFEEWFARKSTEEAWVVRGDDGRLCGFLYLKPETEGLTDVQPERAPASRLKAGTLKVDAHGTRLGERFVRLILDQALAAAVEEVYVTVFPKHEGLIELLTRWGFKAVGQKTGANGTEEVLVRSLKFAGGTVHEEYPFVNVHGRRAFLLGIRPEYHTRLFPDSKLNTETDEIIQDVSHTNSIFKIYIAWSAAAAKLERGDLLVIYRMKDEKAKSAWYSSVATSVCVIDKVLDASGFAGEQDFVDRCLSYSVFSEDELRKFWRQRRRDLVAIRMVYNFALPKRPTRKALVEEAGLDGNERWNVLFLTPDQLTQILRLGQADERLIVDQA